MKRNKKKRKAKAKLVGDSHEWIFQRSDGRPSPAFSPLSKLKIGGELIQALTLNIALTDFLQKVVIEPRHGLQEGLLLGKLLVLLANISSDGKSMLDTRVQVDLVRLASLQ